jgi:hypothetical protein
MSGYYNRDRIWLYSSNFSDTWWGYDDKCSDKLDKIYNDYNKRKTVLNDKKNTDIVIPQTDPIVDKSHVVIAKCNFDTVDYTDDNDGDSDKSVDIDSDFNYLVDFNNIKFFIDLEHWQQINSNDANKKRKIKRIEFPPNVVGETARKNYLISNYGFRGIAGTPV